MNTKKYKIYLDVCCLNRPFDNLSDARVKLEADAVLTILSKCEAGEWTLVSSDVIEREVSLLPDLQRLQKVQSLMLIANAKLNTTASSVRKAEAFQKKGVKVFDSYHLAVAIENGCDVFLTTDDRFLKKAVELKTKTIVENPAKWIVEVI